MIYRSLSNGFNVSVLCFGTATFAAGKLFPYKDSEAGISALITALNDGINFIHSNPKLLTQWAIRKALEKIPKNDIHHAVKVECPLDATESQIENIFNYIISSSQYILGINKIHVIIYEIDIKKTKEKSKLNDVSIIKMNFNKVKNVFERFYNKHVVDLLFCMCHNHHEMEAALNLNCFDGYAAYFNFLNIWPSNFLDRIYESSKDFIGIRPLAQGLLTNQNFHKLENKKLLSVLKSVIREKHVSIQAMSIKFTLAHPVVKSVIVGFSQSSHVKELVDAAQKPLSLDEYKKILEKIRGSS